MSASKTVAAARIAWLMDVCDWTWRVKVHLHLSTELLVQVREAAEAEAIKIFGRNLHELLLAAPAGPKAVLGLDPGIRTGCKVAVVDATGKLLETDDDLSRTSRATTGRDRWRRWRSWSCSMASN